MKTSTQPFLFVAFGTHLKAMLLLFLLPHSMSAVFGQVTATEDFENETAANTGAVFSESGINFTTTFPLRDFPLAFPSGSYGYTASAKFLEIARVGMVQTTTATISLNTVSNPGIGFRINSFAAYTAANNGGTIPNNGILTVSGTPVGGGALVTVNIPVGSESGTLPSGQTREANGMVNGLTLGSAFNGLFFTSLTFTIVDTDLSSLAGTSYLGLDHISFTTQAPVTNNYAIGNISYVEGTGSNPTYAFVVNRSINTAAGSVQIQSGGGTATVGTDYTAIPLTTVSFTAGGALSQTVNVTLNGDALIEEPDETFNLTLSNPVGGTIASGTAVVTIADDDLYVETFEDETNLTTVFTHNGIGFKTTDKLVVKKSSGFGAGGSAGFVAPAEPYVAGTQGALKITTAGRSFTARSVDLWAAAVSGTAPNWIFTPTNCIITFRGTKADGTGAVTHTANITPTNPNGHTTVSFAGSPLANIALDSIFFSTPSGIHYLQIDNFKYGIGSLTNTQLSIDDVSVIEGTGGGSTTATFTVSRTNNTSAFTVNLVSSNGSATAGSDYTAFPSTTLTFTNGGALSQTVNVTVLRDATIEQNETFNMTLSGATNSTVYLKQVGIGTIQNDDSSIETFETETNNAMSFSESGANFTTSGGYSVRNASTFGSGSSNFYLTSSSTVAGNMGTWTLTTANKVFKINALDAWVGTSETSHSSGSVTFTGTLHGGGTVTTTKTITATSATGAGWQQNITFTGTPLDNVLLTAIQVSTAGGLIECDIDNFNYTLFTPLPIIEVTDASNNAITNGGAASTINNTDFGSTTCSTGGTISKTFTIKNTGFVNLTLSGSPLAVLGGTDAGQFTITAQPTTPITSGGSTTVTIRYNPTVAGTHNATFTLTNNDATNSSYVVNIKGTSTSSAGNPSVFGTNTWNVYAWNAGGGAIASAGNWATNYSGFYTNSNLSFNTTTSWANTLSPSSAVATANTTAYQGCTVGVDNHSWSAKRQGFPCSMYQLDIPTHDNAVQLWINGTKVFEHDGCCDAHTNVWTGFLGTNDQVEFRATEGTGNSEGQLTLTPLSLSPTTTNNALAFDGANDYVVANNCTPIINGGSAITVEYWFKGTVIQSAVRSQNGGDYMVAGWSSPAKHILSNDGGTSGGVSVGAAATDNTWHHIAFTWQQGTTNGFKSYLDGALVQQRDAANVALPAINAVLYLGAFNGTSEFMSGALDEVRIWNVARTQSQIQIGRNPCTFTLPQTGLVVYYKFDHGVGGSTNTTINTMVNSASTTTFPAVLSNFALTGANSNWTTVSCAVLPIELTSIKVVAQPTGNLLTWVTASEVNVAHFAIERSVDGLSFEKIGETKAQGKGSTYQFTDNQTSARFETSPTLITYYRVRSIDNDGTESLSKIVSITRKSTGSLKIYPSIATSYLNIETDLTDNFSIINALGQVQMMGKIMHYVDINALPIGVYVFRIGQAQAKFVKQ